MAVSECTWCEGKPGCAVCGSADEIAALRARVAELEAALRSCRDLFSDIRNDWTDPRSECREGWAIIDRALEPADGR